VAILSGAILHDVHGFVVDRIQTGGVGNINQNEERIQELGNWRTVATIRDVPDLTFDLESLDTSTEIEALLTGVDPTTVSPGDEFDLIDSIPIDVISPFKQAKGLYNTVKGVIVPYLTLESATYRFGLRQNSTQAFSLRGDSVYYIPGTPYYEEFDGDGTDTTFSFAHTAIPYVSKGTDRFALSVMYVRADGTYKRLYVDDDYTETNAGITLETAAPAGSRLRVVYGSLVAANYPQTVHQGVSVKPAAVRGKDIDVYVGTPGATPVFERWTSVQSVEVTRRVNLENDEEFGNEHFVDQSYDRAEVTGNINLRPRDADDLWAKLHAISNVPTDEVMGTLTSTSVPVEIRVHDPETGARLKTLYIADARFTMPGIQGRAGQKTETQLNFASDEGQLLIYSGARS
jgi:hypothetical protein